MFWSRDTTTWTGANPSNRAHLREIPDEHFRHNRPRSIRPGFLRGSPVAARRLRREIARRARMLVSPIRRGKKNGHERDGSPAPSGFHFLGGAVFSNAACTSPAVWYRRATVVFFRGTGEPPLDSERTFRQRIRGVIRESRLRSKAVRPLNGASLRPSSRRGRPREPHRSPLASPRSPRSVSGACNGTCRRSEPMFRVQVTDSPIPIPIRPSRATPNPAPSRGPAEYHDIGGFRSPWSSGSCACESASANLQRVSAADHRHGPSRRLCFQRDAVHELHADIRARPWCAPTSVHSQMSDGRGVPPSGLAEGARFCPPRRRHS